MTYVVVLESHEDRSKKNVRRTKEAKRKELKARTVPDRLAKIAMSCKRGRPAPVVETRSDRSRRGTGPENEEREGKKRRERSDR